MTSTPAPGPARKGSAKGSGQWALGYREPLNPAEQFKKDDGALNVRNRIIHTYSKRGFASIDPNDLRGRFRWMGLYTQRAPGFDGGKTATVDPAELDDEFFMMRVRSDGALLSPAAVRVLGEIGTQYGRGTADITDRQNIQYHWIRIEDVPTLWERLEEVGLTTMEACGDSPRAILGSPVAGIAADELVDATPAIEEITRRYLGDPELANLPRKFKTSASGHPAQDAAPEINDVSFVGTLHPEHGPGFDLWVGGGLSTNPMLAKKLGVWIPLEDVPDVWQAVAQVFRDYGYRRLRSRARLKFLLADWGVEQFRQVLEAKYLGRALVDCPSPESPSSQVEGDHIGVHDQKDGRKYVGLAPTVGRITAENLERLADLMERHGVEGARLTAYQKLVLIGVPVDAVDALLDDLEEIGLTARPSAFRRGTMACTGIEFCKLAIVETKARASALVDELERRFPELDSPITINLNGCPNSCARIQVADIGLKGQLVTDAQGRQVEGYQVHLGGRLGLEAGWGKKLRAHKVTSEQLDDYVSGLVQAYLDERTDGETFNAWLGRAEEDVLRGTHESSLAGAR